MQRKKQQQKRKLKLADLRRSNQSVLQGGEGMWLGSADIKSLMGVAKLEKETVDWGKSDDWEIVTAMGANARAELFSIYQKRMDKV